MSVRHLIDGALIDSASGRTFEICNPSTETVTACAALGGELDVDRAVQAARRASPAWWALGPAGRSALVDAGVERALAQIDDLARLQCEEMGQPWSLSRPLAETHVSELAQVLTAAREYEFEKVLHADAERETVTLRVPYGVAALITPWNFPLPVSCQGLGRLLAGGNTVVWKPSELSPSCAVRLAELLDLPPGVLNVILGDAVAGRALACHEDIGIVSFTGSFEAGREVAQISGRQLRHAALELGGKDPVIIDAGVDPEWAAEIVGHGAFWNSGQVCTSMERIYVHANLATPFIEALVAYAEHLVVGEPLDPITDLGPLACEAQRWAVEGQLADAVSRGATALTGGRRLDRPGHYVAPTVLVDVDSTMNVMTRETFGPLAPVQVVGSFDEALALASGSDYGLCATVLTNDDTHARAARQIPAAMCWINEWQGGAAGMVHEPARCSGMGPVGSLDYVTRPMTWHRAPARV